MTFYLHSCHSCCSVARSCLTLCNPMDCSTPGFPVLHHLLEFAQTHVHGAGDAILRMRWLDGNGHESEKAPEDGEGHRSLACYSPWGCKESDMTERLNNNKAPNVHSSTIYNSQGMQTT